MGLVEDALKNIKKPVKKIFDPLTKSAAKFLKNIPKDMNKGLTNIEDDVNGIPDTIFKPISQFMKKNVEDPIMDLIDGIDEMILNFAHIVCFINKSPVRIRNLSSSFENVFNGVIEEFVSLGYAFALGFNSISSMVYYIFTFVGSYLECGVKFSQNIFFCLPFYIFDIIGQILYLPIRLLLWVFSTFLAINLYATEKKVWNGLDAMSEMLFPYIGFHLVHYPKNVRENCYVCVRLKEKVVVDKAKDVDETFREEIPDILTRSREVLNKGGRQFAEVFAYPIVKEPQYV
jgi:hypothetical protein